MLVQLAHVTCCPSVEHVLSMIVKRSPACLAPSSASRYGVPRLRHFLLHQEAISKLFLNEGWTFETRNVETHCATSCLFACINVCEAGMKKMVLRSGQFKCEFKFRILNDAIRKIDVERTNLWSSAVWLPAVAQVF